MPETVQQRPLLSRTAAPVFAPTVQASTPGHLATGVLTPMGASDRLSGCRLKRSPATVHISPARHRTRAYRYPCGSTLVTARGGGSPSGQRLSRLAAYVLKQASHKPSPTAGRSSHAGHSSPPSGRPSLPSRVTRTLATGSAPTARGARTDAQHAAGGAGTVARPVIATPTVVAAPDDSQPPSRLGVITGRAITGGMVSGKLLKGNHRRAASRTGAPTVARTRIGGRRRGAAGLHRRPFG